MQARTAFYYIKPFVPRRLQIELRRKLILQKMEKTRDIWPIDESAATPPARWNGWPEEKQFALVLTHDVDTAKGQNNCWQLISLEEKLGFRSSFNFVPERYEVSPELRHYLTSRGFEVGVHGLNHDGKLYNSREIFKERAARINRYINEWGSVGFRSPAMHHNLEWIHDLDIKYDASTFDTDPFEPQADGMRTIFPFQVSHPSQRGYLELPYTLPQDFTLYILLKERGIDIWKKKVAWVAEQGGMVLLNVHPDYMNFSGKKNGLEEYPAAYYKEFLEFIKKEYHNRYWHVLPKEMADFWNLNGC